MSTNNNSHYPPDPPNVTRIPTTSSTTSTSSSLTLRPSSVTASTISTTVPSIYSLSDKKKSLDASYVSSSRSSNVDAPDGTADPSRSRRLKNSLKKTVSAMGAPPTMEYDVETGRASKRLGVSPMGCGIQSHV